MKWMSGSTNDDATEPWRDRAGARADELRLPDLAGEVEPQRVDAWVDSSRSVSGAKRR